MTLSQDIAFYCRHCNLFVPISLPLPILEQTEASLKGSAPMAAIGPEQFVACPKCAVVYPCRAAGLRLLALETPDQRLDRHDIRLIQAQFVCGTENCETHVTVHTIVPNGTKHEGLQRIASRWDFRALVCPGCHAFLWQCLIEPVFPGFEPLN